MAPPSLHLLRLSGLSILRQLQLEEALYRTSQANWFLINDGTLLPAIVLGLSGRGSELVHTDRLPPLLAPHALSFPPPPFTDHHDHDKGNALASRPFHPPANASHIALIRRYSGGGTVIVDQDTIFATLVLNASDVGVDSFPHPLMRYAASFFAPAFSPYGEFALRENDFVFGGRKFGGNAQAISKGRFVHHTSFLWDYHPDRMSLLKNPKKQPAYREQRGHDSFVVPLKDLVGPGRREHVIQGMVSACQKAGFDIKPMSLERAERDHLHQSHLRGTRVLPTIEAAG